MMFSLSRCPRCGGHRLVRRCPREILVVCAGCGLTTTEPELPPPPAATITATDLRVILARHHVTMESSAFRPSPRWMKHL